jgi:tetratricopeptide (TPR) repeat protein
MASGPESEWADLTPTVDRVRTLDDLGDVLRQLRRRHARRASVPELTVRELARRTGYAYGVISEYLSGKALAPTDRFDVLIRLLGASTAEQRALATARDRVEERRRGRGPAVPRELPPDVHGFTGRGAELAELDRLLLVRTGNGSGGHAHGVPLIVAIVGTAGVGKTALAVHWGQRVGAAFPDGCLYADLRGYDPDRPVAPAEALAAFLRSLGVSGADVPPTEAERAARYRTLLAGRRAMVVLDNAVDTEHARPLLAGGAGCVVLVTSRDALSGLVARHGAHRLELDPLPADDAVGLLGALVGRRVADEPTAASALADRCARLPLTLRLTAELASIRPHATLAELDAELADIRHRLRRLDAAGDRRTASRAVFSWSYQNLAPPTARAFRLLGLYPGRDLDEYGMAALAGVDLDQARLLLGDLARAHLVQLVRLGRYGMHDLLRAYAAERAADEPDSERRAAAHRLLDQQLYAAALAVDLIAPFDRERRPKVADPGWPVPRLSTADAAFDWLDAERDNILATALHGGDWDRPGHAARLAAILVRYLDVGAHHADAELLYRRAADGAPPAERAHVLISLGIVCWRLGRYREAAVHHERALALARQVGDEGQVGRALLGLGIVYWHLGRTAETLDCGEQALELYRRLGDRIGRARVLGNLGKVHGLLGNYAAALDHHRRALELFRAAGDPAGAGNELAGLAAVLEKVGRFAEALDHLDEALRCARQAGYRECEAEVLSTLGIVHMRLNRLGDALEHCRRALDLSRTIADRTMEGYALGHLGAVRDRLGDHTAAADHHREALRIAREIGDDHLAAESLNRLGDALLAGPRAGQALRAYRRALAKASHTGNRYQQARAHDGIARASAAGEAAGGETARPHREQALALYADLGVPDTARG